MQCAARTTMGRPNGVFARDKKRQELPGGAGNHRHGGELDIRQVVEGLLVRDRRRVVGEIVVLAVQNDVVDVARPPYVLHVAIDIHGQRIRRERRIVVDALFEELPPGRVVHDPLLVEGAVEIGVRPLDDTLPSGQPSHLAA